MPFPSSRSCFLVVDRYHISADADVKLAKPVVLARQIRSATIKTVIATADHLANMVVDHIMNSALV